MVLTRLGSVNYDDLHEGQDTKDGCNHVQDIHFMDNKYAV